MVIAGGGTAGHVNPAIALARSMPDEDVTFIGTDRGAEARLVPSAGFSLDTIEVAGFDRAKPWLLPRTGLRAGRAVTQARRILKRRKARALVGMGGYVSLPAVVAARTLRIPIVLHEQNIVLGLAHKVSKPLATKIAVSFEETLAHAGPRGVYVGNPIADEFTEFDRDTARQRALDVYNLDPARRTILVFGGSQGAKRINDAAAGLPALWRDRRDLQILHIAGRTAYANMAAADPARSDEGCLYRVVEFVEDMTLAYAVADLALCRGGATTLAELAAVGLPAIVVPYPYHRDMQQERQARVAERAGAAVVLDDAATDAASVAGLASNLLGDAARLEEMGARFRELARPDAARRLADVVRGVAA